MKRVKAIGALLLGVLLLCGAEMPQRRGPFENDRDDYLAWQDSLTDPFGNHIMGSAAAYYDGAFFFPLLAALPEDNLYLYQVYGDGMVLFQDGMGTYFDWPGLTPRFILPEMSYFDYDGDGEKDVAVTLYAGSGSDMSLMDLHILTAQMPDECNGYQRYADHVLLGSDVRELLPYRISGTLSEDKKEILVDFEGQSYRVKTIFDEKEFGKFEGVRIDEIVEFGYDGTDIWVEISVGASI